MNRESQETETARTENHGQKHADGGIPLAELRDLYDEVGDLLDDDQMERLPDFFLDDCVYKIISKENFDEGLPHATVFCDGKGMLRDRIMALRETQVFEPRALRHFISGVRVLATDGGITHARANVMITECMADAEPRVLMVGRYLDQVQREGDALKFKERLVVFDNYRVHRSLVVPV